MAIIRKTQASIEGLPGVLSGFTSDIATHQTALDLLTADNTTVGSIDYKIHQIVGSAPAALDTLQEIAASLNDDATLDATLRDLISTNISSAKAAIIGGATGAYDTLAEVENRFNTLDNTDNTVVGSLAKTLKDAEDYTDTSVAGLLAKSDNLASLTDVAAARTNLDVYSKSEVDAITGATPNSESVTVSGDTIVLSQVPISGMILNFATARNTDSNGTVTDIPVVIDTSDNTGKTFTLQPDNSGDFDGKNVVVQYIY